LGQAGLLVIAAEPAITAVAEYLMPFLPNNLRARPPGHPGAVLYSIRRSLINVSVLNCFATLPETRMPRAASQPDPLNISWHSPALEGQLSVRQALDKLNAPARTTSNDVRDIDSRSRRPV